MGPSALRRVIATVLAALSVAGLGCLAVPCQPGEGVARPAISYTLEPRPATGRTDAVSIVRMTVDRHGARPFAVEMPAWTPGEYRMQNHGRYVRNLRVERGSAAAVNDDLAGAWRVTPSGTGPVVLSYELPNTRPGIFTENVRVGARHAFYNGTATFLYVADRKAEPITLTVKAPPGWQPALTPLEMLPSGDFLAPDYDTLADASILVGERVERSFDLRGKPHTVAFFGSYRGVDYRGYVEDIRRIVEAGSSYMGSLPYPRYVFYLDMDGRGGGLEHTCAARLALPSSMPPRFAATFLAHEYFHLWNVKRIRPAALGPFDYRRPARTRNLWFCEGATEYVAQLLTLRAGLMSEEDFLQNLANSVISAAKAGTVTADQASLKVWEEGRSSGYRGVSIYLTGTAIGLCLDLRLLSETSGRKGLREVLRDLMDRHAPPAPGYGEDGIREAVIRAGGPAMGPFYDRLCRSTQPLPVEECLALAGMRVQKAPMGLPSIVHDPSATKAKRLVREAWLYGR